MRGGMGCCINIKDNIIMYECWDRVREERRVLVNNNIYNNISKLGRGRVRVRGG
jgi:hypothetical protein